MAREGIEACASFGVPEFSGAVARRSDDVVVIVAEGG